MSTNSTLLPTHNVDVRVAHRARCLSKHYPFLLVFVREFTDDTGCTRGWHYEDDLPFCSKKDAYDWVCAVNRQNQLGKINYKVVAYKVAPLFVPPALSERSDVAKCELYNITERGRTVANGWYVARYVGGTRRANTLKDFGRDEESAREYAARWNVVAREIEVGVSVEGSAS